VAGDTDRQGKRAKLAIERGRDGVLHDGRVPSVCG
jgi:hypothetical protein